LDKHLTGAKSLRDEEISSLHHQLNALGARTKHEQERVAVRAEIKALGEAYDNEIDKIRQDMAEVDDRFNKEAAPVNKAI